MNALNARLRSETVFNSVDLFIFLVGIRKFSLCYTAQLKTTTLHQIGWERKNIMMKLTV